MHSSSSVCIYLCINVIDSAPSQIVMLFAVCVLRFQNSIEILCLRYLLLLAMHYNFVLFIALHYRVLGFTGIVRTDCNRTTELLTHTNLEWPIFVNPISLLIIFWMSTSELRLYLFHTKSKVCCVIGKNSMIIILLLICLFICSQRKVLKPSVANKSQEAVNLQKPM